VISVDVVITIDKRNLVAPYRHQIWQDNDEYITMHFLFRFNDDENIVKHRDSLQQIPKMALHNNSLY
jgi:predicted SnoaL-like aldol condensation-catalyzing enzyme